MVNLPDASRVILVTVFLSLMLVFTEIGPHVMADDTLRPEIAAWGFDSAAASSGMPFIAWANVSDYESGVRNVTLVVWPGWENTTLFPLAFNGTLYTDIIPSLEADRVYTLKISAFDMANNSAESYSRTVDRRSSATTPIDPNKTAPVVITSSIIMMVAVSIVACIYDRRHGIGVSPR